MLRNLETTMLDFYPPKLDELRVYTLFCEGVKGLDYQGSKLIQVRDKEAAKIYIETDKGAYRPGDLLRFRVVILNENAKPMKIREPIKIQIFVSISKTVRTCEYELFPQILQDSLNNPVKQFKDIRLHKGFYSDNFQISTEPNLGNWTLKLLIGGKYALEKIAEFEVNKYVLPKFIVHIEMDEHFAEEDRYIKINAYKNQYLQQICRGKSKFDLKTK
ncbi:murinoglobulin-1-like isoform X1 [Lucilia sericata]|uniref:murinoglobulin-1-like isoform X1 n=1 Tax=Lucilia sericata TaxID=13632 RepID=UPI0018A87D79|nr:murinoglobulin-1-like isoform X1 [Lucilia sericata]